MKDHDMSPGNVCEICGIAEAEHPKASVHPPRRHGFTPRAPELATDEAGAQAAVGPAPPIPTIAQRVGDLVADYLAGDGLGHGYTHEKHARWRHELGARAIQLHAEAVGREPLAVNFVELIQYMLGYAPGCKVVIPGGERTLREFRQRLPEFFEPRE